MHEFSKNLHAKKRSFHDKGINIILIAPILPTALAALKERYDLPQRVMSDDNLALCAAFGIRDQAGKTPLTCVIDGQQVVTHLITATNAADHISDLLRAAENPA